MCRFQSELRSRSRAFAALAFVGTGIEAGMRQLGEFAQPVSPGAGKDFHRVQDALLRHPPNRHSADAQHLGGLLLSHQELFIDRDGRETLPRSFPQRGVGLRSVLRP